MKSQYVFYFLIAIVLAFLKPNKYSDFSQIFNFSLSIIFFILVFLFIFSQRLRTKNWLRIDVIFLIGFSIVHIQIPFLAAIGIEPSMPNFIWIDKRVVNYATWMSVLATCLWMLGYSISKSKSINRNSKTVSDFVVKTRVYDFILIIAFLLFITTVGTNFLKGAYDTSSWGTGAAYFYLILSNMLYLRIIYFFKSVDYGSGYSNIVRMFFKNKIFSIILIAYCILFLSTGSRGEILKILLAAGAAYTIFVKPVKLKVIVISLLIGAFTFTVMGAGRVKDYQEAGNQSVFSKGFEVISSDGDEELLTSELASSVRIQYRAIESVPEKHPYLYGLTYIPTLTSVVPFLTGFYVDAFDIPKQYTGSAIFFTYLGQGRFYTYGEGSEILGDIYINFGIYGVFIVMFLFGYILSSVEGKAYNLRFIYIIIYVSILMSALIINRASLLTPLVNISYLLILHFIFSKKISSEAYKVYR